MQLRYMSRPVISFKDVAESNAAPWNSYDSGEAIMGKMFRQIHQVVDVVFLLAELRLLYYLSLACFNSAQLIIRL